MPNKKSVFLRGLEAAVEAANAGRAPMMDKKDMPKDMDEKDMPMKNMPVTMKAKKPQKQ